MPQDTSFVEQLRERLFPTKAMTRVGHNPVSGSPIFNNNVGEYDPLTQRIRIDDSLPTFDQQQTALHEDVHAIVQQTGVLDKLAKDDFKAFENFSTDSNLTGRKLLEEILAEGLARGNSKNKESLIRKVEQVSPERQDTIKKLRRIARASSALNEFKRQINEENRQ